MRVVFAPDSFKGSITAADAAAALAQGWARVRPDDEAVLRPMADGGEGTVAAFAAAVPGARHREVPVTGPDGAPHRTTWLQLPPTDAAPGGTGVVDLASTSGIELLGGALRPWDADSRGFGEAIAAALEAGVSALVLGIGSSASTDGGLGLLTALGARFFTAAGEPVAPGAAGLTQVASVDVSGLRSAPAVTVLSDVTNPLTGPKGAAAVFGPQKGLTQAADHARVDAAQLHVAGLLAAAGFPADPEHPGTGAAGGVGCALLAWGAALTPGSGAVAELIGLREALSGADVAVTGEGSYDGQSGDGKVPSLVAGWAREAGATPLLAAGRIDELADLGLFDGTASLTDLAGSGQAARTEAAAWLVAAGAALAATHAGEDVFHG